jgi:hypothetical protein
VKGEIYMHHRDVDFRPAPPGWLALFRIEGGTAAERWDPVPLAGWLIQEEIERDSQTDEPTQDMPPGGWERCISPACYFGGDGLISVEGMDNFVTVIAPGTPLPLY